MPRPADTPAGSVWTRWGRGGRIEHIFEAAAADDLDARRCAEALAGSVVRQRRLDAELVRLVEQWADLHPLVPEDQVEPGWTPVRQRTQTRVDSYGAEGTPAVSQFAATELGVLLEMTTTSAGNLLRDVVDLRHRHPRLHHDVVTGRTPLWQARQVARATARAGLGLIQAQWVDAQTFAAVRDLPFSRALLVVEGKVVAADPDRYEQRRAEEAQRRYVSVGRRPNEYGLRTLVAQSSAGVIARFYAMLTHVAELMLAAGDTDPAPVRRAKALALLANPALACVFLAQARTAHDTRLAHPVPEQAGAPRRERPRQPEEPPAPEEPHVSAADQAVTFGHLLTGLGARALDRLRPSCVLYVHLAEEAIASRSGPGEASGEPGPGTQVARCERLGALSLPQLREWLHTTLGADQVVVKPVTNPGGSPPADCYEVPASMREQLHLLHPYEVFPYGTSVARDADADHTSPYLSPDHGGPPGQTRLDNLGPLGRHHHRAKTFGGFTVHQPLPGMYLWRTPTGHWYLVDNRGTHPLGTTTPAILRQQCTRALSGVDYRYAEPLCLHLELSRAS